MRVLRRVAVLAPCFAAVAGCGTYHLPSQPTATVTANPVCGPAGTWTQSALAGAALPEGAVPSPFAVASSAPEATASPSVDGATLDVRRTWQAGRSGVAFVELWAFPSDADATSAAERLVSVFASGGATGTPSTQIPGGTEYMTHGPGGQGYGIVAERDKVLMEVVIGGPGVTQATDESLAAEQYDRLCTHA